MITEWLVSLGFGLAVWVADLFPAWEVPAWMESSRTAAVALAEQYGVGMGVWVDWGALGLCVTAAAICYGIGLLIKLIRVLIAHVPQFGGAGG